VLVLVLDPLGRVLHPIFDYENEDDVEEEKQTTGHIRHSSIVNSGFAGLGDWYLTQH